MCAWMIEGYSLRCERPLSDKLLTKGRTVPDRVIFGAVLLRQETVCRYGEQHCRLWCGARSSPLSVTLLPRCPSLSLKENSHKRTPPLRSRSSKHKCRNAQSLVTHASAQLRWCEIDQIHLMGLPAPPCEIWPKQDAGKRRIYQLAGVARAPRNTHRCRLIQFKGVPLLVPIR
jgi:hypothetical protein